MKANVKKQEINVWLSERLFKDLKDKLEKHNQKIGVNKLSLSISAYFLNLVIYIPTTRKDKYEDGWVPICSEIYKNVKNFSKYMKFLVESKFLIIHGKKYSTSKHTCLNYKLSKKYISHPVKFLKIKGHKSFTDKRNKEIKERMLEADNSCSHLTKWLHPENFIIDYDNAQKYISDNFSKAKKNNKKDNKRDSRTIVIDKIQNKIEGYSRQGKDNRLHTNFTSMPSDLRKFIEFSQGPISSIDIKNSQPFILSSLIQLLIGNIPSINNCSNHHHISIVSYLFNSSYNSIMSDLNDRNFNKEDLKKFITEVQEGVFYENLGAILYKEDIILRNHSGQYFYNHFKKKKGMLLELFESIRIAGKSITMLLLFGKHRNTFVSQVFKKHYGDVAEIIRIIKSKDAGNKGYLASLLQNIEANCILDYCTKNIAEKYPDMPLLTIHDSVLTTIDYIDILENEFRNYLKKYYGIEPKLKIENWNLDLNDAS